MNIKEFFESSAALLPKRRDENDFQVFLLRIMRDYLCTVKQLDNDCIISRRIKEQECLIQEVAGWVRCAVRRYFEGQPETAYRVIRLGIHRLDKFGHLISQNIKPSDLKPLYRMARLNPGELSRDRLFHIPFEKRYLVGRHRYGISGFPCLYLGGSLRVCQIELNIADHELHHAGVAEFELCRPVKLLDFGYPPSIIGRLAYGRMLAANNSNQDLDDFIVNYAICWPIIAVCSIQRMHNGPFSEEYIVPQILMQWLMRETMCDGIRYFSTRMEIADNNPHPTANYVFPALPPPDRGHSQKLKSIFKFSEPCMWQGVKQQEILYNEFELNRTHLSSLEKRPL